MVRGSLRSPSSLTGSLHRYRPDRPFRTWIVETTCQQRICIGNEDAIWRHRIWAYLGFKLLFLHFFKKEKIYTSKIKAWLSVRDLFICFQTKALLFYSWLKSLGLKCSWLKSLGLKGLGSKLGVEKSGVEMFFNRNIFVQYIGQILRSFQHKRPQVEES